MLDKISMLISTALIVLGLVIGFPFMCMAMVMGSVWSCIHEGWIRGYLGQP